MIFRFLCSVCGHAFATKQRLTVHVLTHTGEKQFNCDECDKRFATEQRLRCHQRTHVSSSTVSYHTFEKNAEFGRMNARNSM